MRFLLLLASCLALGCGDNNAPADNNDIMITVDAGSDAEDLGDPSSDMGAEDCAAGEMRTTDPCGLNDRGMLVEVCEDGEWSEPTCDDPDVCEDGATEIGTTACGPAGDGLLLVACEDGAWGDTDECTGLCTDGETRQTSTACGAFDMGVVLEACSAAEWSEYTWREGGSCEDPTVFELLGDLRPGPDSSTSTVDAIYVGEYMVFVASTPTTGRELFVTDGTPAGTTLLFDFEPGPADGLPTPGRLQAMADHAVIGVYDTTANDGVWVTDGTVAGTRRVHASGSPNSSPTAPHVIIEPSNVDPPGIWAASTGSASAEQILSYPSAVSVASSVVGWPDGSKTIFAVRESLLETYLELHCTDGTAAGTTAVGVQVISPRGVFMGDRFYFLARDGTSLGNQLWSTDCVTSIDHTDVELQYYAGLATAGDHIVMAGTSAANGTELWVWDAVGGVRELIDLNPGPESTSFADLWTIGDLALMQVRDSPPAIAPYSIMATDGTVAGTTTLWTSSNRGLSPILTASHLYWVDEGAQPAELWVTDGVTATLLDQANAISPLAIVAGRLVYSVLDATMETSLRTVVATPDSRVVVQAFDSRPETIQALGYYIPVRSDFATFELVGEPTTGLEPWVLRTQ